MAEQITGLLKMDILVAGDFNFLFPEEPFLSLKELCLFLKTQAKSRGYISDGSQVFYRET